MIKKFRIWDGGKKKMWYRDTKTLDGNTTTLSFFNRPQSIGWGLYEDWLDCRIVSGEYVVNVLMQYTGVNDKDDIEIYEGDILRCPHFIDSRGQHYLYHEVRWDKKLLCWKAVSVNNPEGEEISVHGNPQLWVYLKNEGQAEVWANIYQPKKRVAYSKIKQL